MGILPESSVCSNFDVRSPSPTTTTSSPIHTPTHRWRGSAVSVGRHYDMAVEIALATPPDDSRVQKRILGPLIESWRVGPEYPTQQWKNSTAQAGDNGELDLSTKVLSG